MSNEQDSFCSWQEMEAERHESLRNASYSDLILMLSGKRLKVWKKTNGSCFYCGVGLRPHFDAPKFHGSTFVVEHYVPICLGGGNGLENLFPSCQECNYSKNRLTISEWRKRLSAKNIYNLNNIPDFSNVHKRWLLSQGFTLLKEIDDAANSHLFWAEKNGWVMTEGGAYNSSSEVLQ